VDENKTLNSKHPVKTWHNYIDKQWFYPCLEKYLETVQGDQQGKNLRWSSEVPNKRTIIGFKQTGKYKIVTKIATQGP